MKLHRMFCGVLVSGLWASAAFGQAAQVKPVAPRQDWQNGYETAQGSNFADGKIIDAQNAPLNYIGDTSHPSDYDMVCPSYMYCMGVQQIVPHTDDVGTQVNKLTANGGHAMDLHAMRDLTNAETARMAKDTGAVGQAMMVTNNSTIDKNAVKPTIAGDASLGQSVANLNGAGNNALLAQTFSGCSSTVQSNPGSDGGNQYQTKACSYVQLKFTPGFAAHVYRTVTATFPSKFDLLDDTNEVIAFGGTDNWHGTLGTNFPATTTDLTDFTVTFYREGNGPMPTEFTYSPGTIPSKANGWTYNFWISREAQPNPLPSNEVTTGPIMVRMMWTYQGDPVYTYTKPTCDKGDCTITGDEFCKAKWTCNSKLPAMSTNGYLVPVTAADGPPPIGPLYTLIQQLDPTYATDLQTDDICMDATENIDCSTIYSGTYCEPSDPTNPNSPPVCSTVPNSPGLPNDCPQIAADPTCHESGQICADDGQSKWDGYCYVMTEQFTCFVQTPVSNGNVSTITQCPGNQPCMDGSCNVTYYHPGDTGYSRTRALGQQVIAQHFLNDWETNDEYANDPLNQTDWSNASPGNAANGTGSAAALADYHRLLKAQAHMLAQHPDLAAKLLNAGQKANAATAPAPASPDKE